MKTWLFYWRDIFMSSNHTCFHRWLLRWLMKTKFERAKIIRINVISCHLLRVSSNCSGMREQMSNTPLCHLQHNQYWSWPAAGKRIAPTHIPFVVNESNAQLAHMSINPFNSKMYRRMFSGSCYILVSSCATCPKRGINRKQQPNNSNK